MSILLRKIVAKAGPGRFIVAGGVNTAASYALYAILCNLMSYMYAYSLSFVAGIMLSYLLNTIIVFERKPEKRSIILFPLVYAVQLTLGLLCLPVLVNVMGIPAVWAGLLVSVVTIPFGFFASRYVFQAGR